MLDKPEKNSKLTLQIFHGIFNFGAFFAGVEPYYRVSGPAGPENGPKPQGRPKNVFWSYLWLEEELRAGRPHLSHVPWGCLTVLEGLETPTERF